MKQRRILINAVMSLVQVVVTGAVLFFLYRFLLSAIGVEKLGVWSIVLATTSVASISNIGISAGIVKFVAKYAAREEDATIVALIDTAAISVAGIVGLGLLVIYPCVNLLLEVIIPPSHLRDALSILPYAAASLWITIVAGVYQSGLDGYQRIDKRSVVLSITAVFYLGLSIVFVRSYGFIGLAYAQLMNACIVLAGCWIMLKRHLPALSLFPKRWNHMLFRELVGYGVKFQAISIATLLFEPTTKTLLTKFGGLAMTGYYEMANKMILQFRSLIISANQVLVPAIADLQETRPEAIRTVYKDSYRLLVYFALPLFSALIAISPIVSELWLGHYERLFVLFSALLGVGWFCNTLIVPAYFANMGTGDLMLNLVSHAVTGISNVLLGFVFGLLGGGIAVVAASVFSLFIGSIILIYFYHKKHNIPFRELLPVEDAGLAVGSLSGLIASTAMYYSLGGNTALIPRLFSVIIVYVAIIAVPSWRHPLRARLMMWIQRYLLTGSQNI
jgi:O-antigen/teichoic acid export membrane protein